MRFHGMDIRLTRGQLLYCANTKTVSYRYSLYTLSYAKPSDN